MELQVSGQSSDRERRVVFLKLRRIGGTTLSASVLYPYCVKHGLDYMVPQGWWAAHPLAVPGNHFHMMFRHFPDYPQPWARNWLRRSIGEYRLITIVRDPLDRFVSAFNHVAHYFGVKTIDEYREIYGENNHQSRWLGFYGRDDEFLERTFDGVGLTERMNESFLLFRRALDMNLEDMLYASVYQDSPKMLRKSDLTDRQVARIKRDDWLDCELHSQATALFNRRITSTPGLDDELKEFEGALADLSHPLWGKRGPFQVGFSPDNVWYECSGQHGAIKQIAPVPP
ncbi:MAG: sulfotransferase family 2 domain-containing protein [Gammaproteobacteria bacterium]